MDVAADGRKDCLVSSPNIVPLIDVLLVLIIIFMVITPEIPTGLPALAPQPGPPNSRRDPRLIVVQVLPGDALAINDESTNWDALGGRLSAIFSTRAEKVAFVKGARDVPFAQVARAIDVMRGAGIEQVGLITPGVESATNPPIQPRQ
jgi:biopolymer transport protein TolR